jgi:hypothetical protein
MSPTCYFIPPLLIFTRKNRKQELMNGTQPGSNHACHPSGWTESEFFTQWFLHFIKHTKPTKEDPVILVLDGHCSHARKFEVITLARENHVHIICLLRHSSHKIQHLDNAFFGPLKTFYCQEIEKWLRSNPGPVATVYQTGELFGSIHKRPAAGEIAGNGFWTTDLFPRDKNPFRPHDFPLTSENTEAAPVNRPTLVETSDQPSFNSANFSPSTSAVVLRASDISPVPSLNLMPNPRGAGGKFTLRKNCC